MLPRIPKWTTWSRRKMSVQRLYSGVSGLSYVDKTRGADVIRIDVAAPRRRDARRRGPGLAATARFGSGAHGPVRRSDNRHRRADPAFWRDRFLSPAASHDGA